MPPRTCRLLWAAGSLAAVAATHPPSCHTTRLGRPCVAWGANDFGIEPESTACHKLIHIGTQLPLCYVSERRDEVGVCIESCRPWSAPAVYLPHGLEAQGSLRALDSPVELIQQGRLDEAEKALTADIKRMFVRQKSKHPDSSGEDGREEVAGADEAQDEEEVDSTSVVDLVTAAHSLMLLGQINHDQGALSRAQLHLEMACKLLDQIYGAPFERGAAGSYSTECYEELLAVLAGQQQHRKALEIESYMRNDDELFPPSDLADKRRSRREETAVSQRDTDTDTEEQQDADEDDERDEEDDEDDTMTTLKAIIRSFVQASPTARRKMTRATAAEVSSLLPEISEENTGLSRIGAAVGFVHDLMQECVAGGKKIRAQNEHCRRHVDTEVASLLASIEYSKQKVEDAHFVVSLQGQGPVCLPQQQMLRSKSYELSMLVELALSFQEELQALLEDEEAVAGRRTSSRSETGSSSAEPTPWSWLEALAIGCLTGLVGLPAAKHYVELKRKAQSCAWNASKTSARGQAKKRLGSKPPPPPPPQQQQQQQQQQLLCAANEQQPQIVGSRTTADEAAAVSKLQQSRRVSKKAIRRQRKAKQDATLIGDGNTENRSVHSLAPTMTDTETTARALVEELVKVASTAGTTTAAGTHADTDMNDIEPLSLWNAHREPSLAGVEHMRKPSLPKSPVWSVRSSDSDGAESVGSGSSHDEEDDQQDVHTVAQREKLTQGKKLHKGRQRKEGNEACAATQHIGHRDFASAVVASEGSNVGCAGVQAADFGGCAARRMNAEIHPMSKEEANTQVEMEKGIESRSSNSTSGSCPQSSSVCASSSCPDDSEKRDRDRDSEDRRPGKSSVGPGDDAATATCMPGQADEAQRSGSEGAQVQQQERRTPRQGLASTAALAAATDYDSRVGSRPELQPAAARIRPAQQHPIVGGAAPRKRMLTAAEVRARDAMEKQSLRAATVTAPNQKHMQARQVKANPLVAGVKKAIDNRQVPPRHKVVDARAGIRHHAAGAVCAVAAPARKYMHRPATPLPARNSAVELVDDGTGTMLVTSPWSAASAAPAQLVDMTEHASIAAHPFSSATLTAVRRQVEYYFSDANLAHDKWLLSQMDADGCVGLGLIATFNRIRALTTSMEELYHALSLSQQLELVVVSWSPPIAKVKRRR